jgi:hypothetical protein
LRPEWLEPELLCRQSEWSDESRGDKRRRRHTTSLSIQPPGV